MNNEIDLSKIKTLKEISEEYEIPIKTLQSRLKDLKEGIDFKKLGKRQPTLVSPQGVEKIIKVNGK